MDKKIIKENEMEQTNTMMLIIFLLAFLILIFLILFGGDEKQLGYLIPTSIKVFVVLIVIGISAWLFFQGDLDPFRIIGGFVLISALTSSFIAILYTTFLANTTNVTNSSSSIVGLSNIAQGKVVASGSSMIATKNATNSMGTESTKMIDNFEANVPNTTQDTSNTDVAKNTMSNYFKIGSAVNASAGTFWNDTSDPSADMIFFMQTLVFTITFLLFFFIGISKIFKDRDNA